MSSGRKAIISLVIYFFNYKSFGILCVPDFEACVQLDTSNTQPASLFSLVKLIPLKLGGKQIRGLLIIYGFHSNFFTIFVPN